MKRLVAVLAALGLALATSGQSQAITYPDRGFVTTSQAPWVVSLWEVDAWDDRGTGDQGFFCTGALIDAHTVVTAAHCMTAIAGTAFVVVQGQANRSSRGVVLMPRDIKVHAGFNPQSLANDIALIDLYDLTAPTAFLKLPTAAQSVRAIAATPTLYGWGQNQNGVEPSYLRKAALPDQSKRAAKLFTGFDAKRQLGAGRPNRNGTYTAACYGDSGGPLVGTLSGKKFLVGITSFGSIKGCLAKTPTVFTRVAAFGKWISAQRSLIASERAQDELDTARASFTATGAKPMSVSNLPGVRVTEAKFTTELMDLPEADLMDLSARSYAQPVGGFDIELRFVPKAAWPSDGCGWDWLGDSQPGLQLSIQDPTSGLTGLVFAYAEGGCLLSAAEMNVVAVRGQVPVGCAAVMQANADGSTSVWLTRECLVEPANTYLRAVWQTSAASDVEPGLDTWAGRFDLTAPTS